MTSTAGLRVRAASSVDRAAVDAFVARRPEADMLQLWAWGDAFAVVGERPERLVAERDGGVVGTAQVLVRPSAMGRSVLYAPHGPVWDRDAADADAILAALLGAIRELAKSAHGVVVKVDPRARFVGDDPEATTSDAGTVGNALRAAGLRPARLDLQARTTRILTVSADEAARVAGWKKEARNRWRRASREGTTTGVLRAADSVALDAFYGMLSATATMHGFHIRPRAFYDRLAAGLAEGGHLRLALATWSGRPIAVRFVATLGDRAFSLYRATERDVPRETYGHHALMGGLLEALAADGIRSMDMWGVAEPGDPNADPSWAAFSEFKLQFGGRPLAHPGAFDLVVDPLWYAIREARERLGGGRRPGAASGEAGEG